MQALSLLLPPLLLQVLLLLLLLRASATGFDVHMAGGIAQLGYAPDFPDTHTVAHTYTQSQRSLRGLRALAHLTTTAPSLAWASLRLDGTVFGFDRECPVTVRVCAVGPIVCVATPGISSLLCVSRLRVFLHY